MTDTTFVYNCKTEADTENLARSLAEISRIGDVWALFGTLGMGKSVFSRAFVKKLTNAAEVPSPTFTLVQTYSAPEFEIYHYDLYRLKSPEEIWELNIEEAIYTGVCLIEWPEKMWKYLPKNIFKVNITPLPDSGREIAITVNSKDKSERLQAIERRADEQINNN